MFYGCSPGLVPEGRMRAVCTRIGWSPNPADLSCTKNIPRRIMFVCLLVCLFVCLFVFSLFVFYCFKWRRMQYVVW